MKFQSILTIMMTVIVLTACQDNKGTSLSPSSVTGMENVSAVTPNVPAPTSGVNSDGQTQCEIINITARRVFSVSPGQVVLLVLASYSGDGTPYVRIIDRESGRPLGDYPLGYITLRLDAGQHELFIFVEVSTPSGGVIQCDGSVSFVIPTTPPPPPPPPKKPECDEDNSSNDEECNPPPPCAVPSIGTSLSWSGPGNPDAECAAFGPFVPGAPGFTICKAGTEREVVANGYNSETCPNGKDISHITTCVCPVS